MLEMMSGVGDDEDEDRLLFEPSDDEDSGSDAELLMLEGLMDDIDGGADAAPVERKAAAVIQAVDQETVSGIRLSTRVFEQDRLDVKLENCSYIKPQDISGNHNHARWFTICVVTEKVLNRGQHGNYTKLMLVDLGHPYMTSMCVFLNSAAHVFHSKKIKEKDVVLLHNATINKSNDDGKGFTLRVNGADQLCIIGTSKDYDRCRARQFNDKACGIVVNARYGSLCSHHRGETFKKIRSDRMDVGSAPGRGPAESMKTVKRGAARPNNLSTGSYSEKNPLAQQLHKKLGAESKRLQKPAVVVICKDGKVIQASSSKNKKSPPVSSKQSEVLPNRASIAVVQQIAQRMEKVGATKTKAQLSRGNRLLMKAVTGTSIDHEAQKELRKSNQDIIRSFHKDPLVRSHGKTLEKKKLDRMSMLQSSIRQPYSKVQHQNVKARVGVDNKIVDTISKNPRLAAAGKTTFDRSIVERNMRDKAAVERKAMQNAQKTTYQKRHAASNALFRDEARKRKEREVLDKLTRGGAAKRALSKVDPNAVKLGDPLGRSLKVAKVVHPTIKTISKPHKVLENALNSTFAKVARRKDEISYAARLKNLAETEKMSEDLQSITMVNVRATTCHECHYTQEQPKQKCIDEDHEMGTTDARKRFFRCANDKCGEKTTTIAQKKCVKTCPGCRGIKWVPCSAYSDKKLGLRKAQTLNVERDGPCTTFNRRG